MKSGQRCVRQWFMVTMILGGTALAVNLCSLRIGETAAEASGQKSSSGTGPTHSTGADTRGEELYNASCVVCHGPSATGGIGPRLAGNPILFNDQAFGKIIAEGRHMMPPLKDAVTEQQLADIRAWLKTLR